MTVAVPHAGMTLKRAFQALDNRNFRIFWLGMLIDALGMRLYVLALTWLVLSRTNSALALGILITIQGLPILLFALFGGVLAERLQRRRLLTVLRTVMLVETLVFAVVLSVGAGDIWVIYVFVALGGVFAAVDIPTTQSFLEDLVGTEQAELANASALTMTLHNVAKVAGALAGGAIIAAFGVAVCLYINAAGILGLLIALLLIDEGLLHPTVPQPAGSVLGKAREGLTYAARTPDVATIVLLMAAIGLFGYNLAVLLPLIVRYVLDSGPFGLGVLTAAAGVGALVGSLVVDFTGRGHRQMVLIGAVALTASFLSLAIAEHWLLMLSATAIVGFCSVLFLATANTRLHLLAPDELRGRIMGIYTILLFGTAPLGGLLAGALANRLGVQQTIALMGGLCALAVVVTLAYVHLRRNDLLPEPGDVPLPHPLEAVRGHLQLSWFLHHRS